MTNISWQTHQNSVLQASVPPTPRVLQTSPLWGSSSHATWGGAGARTDPSGKPCEKENTEGSWRTNISPAHVCGIKKGGHLFQGEHQWCQYKPWTGQRPACDSMSPSISLQHTPQQQPTGSFCSFITQADTHTGLGSRWAHTCTRRRAKVQGWRDEKRQRGVQLHLLARPAGWLTVVCLQENSLSRPPASEALLLQLQHDFFIPIVCRLKNDHAITKLPLYRIPWILGNTDMHWFYWHTQAREVIHTSDSGIKKDISTSYFNFNS